MARTVTTTKQTRVPQLVLLLRSAHSTPAHQHAIRNATTTSLQYSNMVHRAWCNGKHNFTNGRKISPRCHHRGAAVADACHKGRTHTPPLTELRRVVRSLEQQHQQAGAARLLCAAQHLTAHTYTRSCITPQLALPFVRSGRTAARTSAAPRRSTRARPCSAPGASALRPC